MFKTLKTPFWALKVYTIESSKHLTAEPDLKKKSEGHCIVQSHMVSTSTEEQGKFQEICRIAEMHVARVKLD